MKITDNFHYEWKPSHAYHEWDTKENTRNSMKNVLQVQRYGRSISWAKTTSNSEKIKPVTLAIVELCESEGIRQAISFFCLFVF